MKLILISAATLMMTLPAHSQKLKESEVPAIVKQAFTKQFASAKNVKWSKEGDNEFEAEFKSDKGRQSANFDQNGNWLITETEISGKWLPAEVQATIRKEFAGFKIEEVEEAQTPDKGSFFEIELGQKRKTIIAQISVDGKILKQEEEKEGDKKD